MELLSHTTRANSSYTRGSAPLFFFVYVAYIFERKSKKYYIIPCYNIIHGCSSDIYYSFFDCHTPFFQKPRHCLPALLIPWLTSAFSTMAPANKCMSRINIQLQVPKVEYIWFCKRHHDSTFSKEWHGYQVQAGMMRDKNLGHGRLEMDWN